MTKSEQKEMAEALAVVESEVSAIYGDEAIETYEEQTKREACEARDAASAANWNNEERNAEWRKALETYADVIGKSPQTASRMISESLG